MDNSAMATHITAEVIGVLVDQGIVHAVKADSPGQSEGGTP